MWRKYSTLAARPIASQGHVVSIVSDVLVLADLLTEETRHVDVSFCPFQVEFQNDYLGVLGRQTFAIVNIKTNQVVEISAKKNDFVCFCWAFEHAYVLTVDGYLSIYSKECVLNKTYGVVPSHLMSSGYCPFPQDGECVKFDVGRDLWGEFAIYTLTRSGQVYVCCPVFPTSISLPRGEWTRLTSIVSSTPLSRCVLFDSFLSSLTFDGFITQGQFDDPVPQLVLFDLPISIAQKNNLSAHDIVVDDFMYISYGTGLIDVCTVNPVYPEWQEQSIRASAISTIDLGQPALLTKGTFASTNKGVYQLSAQDVNILFESTCTITGAVFKVDECLGNYLLVPTSTGIKSCDLYSNFEFKVSEIECALNITEFALTDMPTPPKISIPDKIINLSALKFLQSMHASISTYAVQAAEFNGRCAAAADLLDKNFKATEDFNSFDFSCIKERTLKLKRAEEKAKEFKERLNEVLVKTTTFSSPLTRDDGMFLLQVEKVRLDLDSFTKRFSNLLKNKSQMNLSSERVIERHLAEQRKSIAILEEMLMCQSK